MSLTPDTPTGPSPASLARALVLGARTATLATLDRLTGHPYASLVTVAADPGGVPILLLSGLALHTRNLLADRRASLLYQGGEATPDPLAVSRVTLIGHLHSSSNAASKVRFLEHCPEARLYAGFSDFAFYEFAIERAHFIGGFGRIAELQGRDLLD